MLFPPVVLGLAMMLAVQGASAEANTDQTEAACEATLPCAIDGGSYLIERPAAGVP